MQQIDSPHAHVGQLPGRAEGSKVVNPNLAIFRRRASSPQESTLILGHGKLISHRINDELCIGRWIPDASGSVTLPGTVIVHKDI